LIGEIKEGIWGKQLDVNYLAGGDFFTVFGDDDQGLILSHGQQSAFQAGRVDAEHPGALLKTGVDKVGPAFFAVNGLGQVCRGRGESDGGLAAHFEQGRQAQVPVETRC
jgi:hypothetical protein